MSVFVNAHEGFGASFRFSTVGSSGVYKTLGAITSITPPSFSRQTFDVTNHNTTDYYEQAVGGGIIRTGTIGISAVFLATSTSAGQYQTELIPECMDDGHKVGWQIVIPGTSQYATWYGDGYVTSYNYTVPTEGRVDFNTTIKITGLPTVCSSCT